MWYTPHRGRLWIASTRQEPSADDIKTVQQLYKSLHDGQFYVKPFHHMYIYTLCWKEIYFVSICIDSVSEIVYLSMCTCNDYTCL